MQHYAKQNLNAIFFLTITLYFSVQVISILLQVVLEFHVSEMNISGEALPVYKTETCVIDFSVVKHNIIKITLPLI